METFLLHDHSIIFGSTTQAPRDDPAPSPIEIDESQPVEPIAAEPSLTATKLESPEGPQPKFEEYQFQRLPSVIEQTSPPPKPPSHGDAMPDAAPMNPLVLDNEFSMEDSWSNTFATSFWGGGLGILGQV